MKSNFDLVLDTVIDFFIGVALLSLIASLGGLLILVAICIQKWFLGSALAITGMVTIWGFGRMVRLFWLDK